MMYRSAGLRTPGVRTKPNGYARIILTKSPLGLPDQKTCTYNFTINDGAPGWPWAPPGTAQTKVGPQQTDPNLSQLCTSNSGLLHYYYRNQLQLSW